MTRAMATFTASEIGEMTNNMIGGAGLVWNTQIMPVAFLDSSGSGTDTNARPRSTTRSITAPR